MSARRAEIAWRVLPALLGALVAGAAVEARAQRDCGSEAQCAEAATVLADRAAERFGEGDYEATAVLLREAIELHETPALHHNLARTLVELERWAEARAEYRASLALDPETAARARIEAEIARLDARLEAPAAEPAPLEAAPSPEPSRAPAPAGVDPAPWVVFGVGLAVGAAAIPFAVLFQDTADRIRASPDHREALLLEGDAHTFAIATDVLIAVGGALALAALIWGLVSLASGGSPSLEAALAGARGVRY